MAVNQEILKLVLQFETAFSGQNELESFLKSNSNALAALTTEGVKLSSSLSNIVTLVSSLKTILETVPKDVLSNVLSGLKGDAEIVPLIAKTKELNEAITALKLGFSKDIDLSKFNEIKEAVQKAFFPEIKDKGTLNKYGSMVADNLKKQFQEFASGNINLSTFLDNLIPKDGFPKGKASIVLQDATNFATELKEIVGKLNADSSVEGRTDVLNAIAKRLLGGTEALVTAKEKVTLSAEELITAITHLTKVASLSIEFGIEPPKNLFSKFPEAFRTQGAEQTGLLKGVVDKIFKNAEVSNVAVDQVNFKNILKQMGFSEADINTQFNSVANAIANQVDNLRKKISTAVELKKLNLGTDNVRAQVTNLQNELSKLFNVGMLQGLGNAFETEFKAALDSLKVFETGATQSLKQFQDFEKGITALKASLAGGVAADNPVAKSLLALLKAYEEVEKNFRLDLILQTQTDALKAFQTRVDYLKNTIERSAPKEVAFKFLTSEEAGVQALKDKSEVLAQFGSLAKAVESKINELRNAIVTLETTKALPEFVDKQDKIQGTINEYNKLKEKLEAQQNALVKEQETWTRAWEKKTADVEKAKQRVDAFNAILNSSTDVGIISSTLQFAKAFIQIALTSDEAKNKLESVFAQFTQFGGISKNSIQNIELFQTALQTLFASMGKGENKVTLIDLKSLQTQTDGTVIATGHLQKQMLELAGSSAEAREQFNLLAFAVNFLEKIGQGQGKSVFGNQLSSLLSLAEGTRSYLNVLELLEIRLKSYHETLARIEDSQNAVNIRLATANTSEGDNRAKAVTDLSAAYKELSRDLLKAETQLKKLKETEQGLKDKKTQFGIEDDGKFARLQISIANAEKEVNKLKEALNTLKVADTGGILKGVIESIDEGNKKIQSSLASLQEQAAKKLAGVVETIRNELARTQLGKELASSITAQIDKLSEALNSANLSSALAAINTLQAEIKKAFTDKTNSADATKELAETYLKPYQNLLKGLEEISVQLARALPNLSISTTEKAKIGEELGIIRTEIQQTNVALNDFGKTANTAQLVARFKEAQEKVIALKTELQGLNSGTVDSTKIGELQTRFSEVRQELISLNKEARALNLKDVVSPLTTEINTIKESLRELGKGSRLDGLQSQFDTLKTAIPPVIANIDSLKNLLQESFAGNKELVNVAPFTKLKNDLQAIERTITDTEQKAPYTNLLKQVQDAIDKTERYNAVVKAGNSRDVGVQAVIDPKVFSGTVQGLNDLDRALTINKEALRQFLIGSNQTKESAKQLTDSFAQTREGVKALTSDAGQLSGISANLEKHIRSLMKAGTDDSLVQVFKDVKKAIDDTIKIKDGLNKAFQGGFTKDLETDLNRLVTAKTLMEQFRAVGESFNSAAFFDSTSYSARQAYEQIQRLESAMRSTKSDIDKSLSVGRRDTIDSGVAAQLLVQRAALEANIAKLKEYGVVYDQLRSKSKIEAFDQLRNSFENITGNGAVQLKAYENEFKTVIASMQASIGILTGGVAPLTEALVSSFKQQSEGIASARQQFEAWLNILKSLRTAGQKDFTFSDGSSAPVTHLITLFEKLQVAANDVKRPIQQTAEELDTKLGTATGQAELRISNLITKFTELQNRINSITPGTRISEVYGSIKELTELLDRPYKSGPFFTLPKESFAPIRAELQSVLELAKHVQTGLQHNLSQLPSGSPSIEQTKEQIKAATQEVERLSAAMLKLSEYEQNASKFSALRGGLHGASTTMNELMHEGAFIYKGLDALFKNLAKSIAPEVKIDSASFNQQIDAMTKRLNISTEAAQTLKKNLNEAFNTPISGGGLAAAEQYQKAFQQLEEAFVKFRSGLTQAAMGFQMLGDNLLEPFKKAKEHFEEFSDIMGVVSAVTNATRSQFDALTDKALVMGATTRFTAQQAAEGLKQLAKAGYSAEQQLGSLPAVMRLAQAAGTELATAATVATVVMQEFRMDPEQFTVAADKITLAANRTLGTVEDLGFAFKYVGALASNIGADFDDLTAAIALLHNSGLKGTMAGTALRGMLMNLYNPTGEDVKIITKLSERIGGLGLQIQDANGNFLGFSSILKQLEQAGITSAEVLKLFGQRAGPGMAALLAQGSDALIELEQDLKNAEGTTAHMAQIMEETLKGKLLLMRSAFEALSDSIGHNLSYTLGAAADAMGDFVSRFVAIRLEFPKLSIVIDHALAGFALFASLLGGLAVTFAFILVPVKQFIGFLRTLVVTTLAGAAALGANNVAQAFNLRITQATIRAVETEFSARLANAVATGADTSQIGLNTIARGINVQAIRAEMTALHGATAAAAMNAAAQGSLWVGFKNILLGLGKNLLNIGGILKWAFTTPWGIALTALTSLVAYTFLHEKSISQANEELKKQNELLAYSQKEAVGLSTALVNTAERIKQTQELLDRLKNSKADQSGFSPEAESRAVQLQVKLDFDKQKLNQQLRELYTRLSEDTSKLKDKVTFEVALDDQGNFTKFKINVKGAAESIDVFAKGTAGAVEQLKKLAPELNRVTEAESDLIAQQQLGNVLRENFGRGENSYTTDFSRNIGVVTKDLQNLLGLGPKVNAAVDNLNKLEKRLKSAHEHFAATKLLYAERNASSLSPFTYGPEIFTGIDKVLSDLEVKATKARLLVNDLLENTTTAVLDNLVTTTKLSADQLARLPNLADLIKEKTQVTFEKQDIDLQYYDDVVNRVLKRFKDIENKTTTKEIASDGFKKPFNEIVSALDNFIGALEEKNKELKKSIKEQADILNDVKPVADALKKYEEAFVKFNKAELDQGVKTLEFKLKLDNDKILTDLAQQIEQITVAGKVVELPFSITPEILTDKSKILKGIASISGTVLSYEKVINEELVALKIQQANQEYETVVKTEQGKQQAIRESLNTITNFYKNKNPEFYQIEQEKLTSILDSLKTEYDANVTHINKLYTLRNGLAQKSRQLDDDYINRQATAADNLQKLAVGSKSDYQKRNFLKEQIKALKQLADEATSSGNLDKAKALLDQQQQLITQAIGEIASTKGKGGYKAFLKESQEQNLEDTGSVIEGLKSQSADAQAVLAAQIEENKKKIQELIVESESLGRSLTKSLAELFKTTKLDIGITEKSYEELQRFAATYKETLRELNNAQLNIGISEASDLEKIIAAKKEQAKAIKEQYENEKRIKTLQQAQKTLKPVLNTQGVSNELNNIKGKTTELYQLLNTTKGKLDEEGLKKYDEGVQAIQQHIIGLKIALKEAKLDPELSTAIKVLIAQFSELNTGKALADQIAVDPAAFLTQFRTLFKTLEQASNDSGDSVGKELSKGYISALTAVVPTIRKALTETIAAGDISGVRDVTKLTQEVINQTIAAVEKLQGLKDRGVITDADLAEANQLLKALKAIKNQADAVNKTSLTPKTPAATGTETATQQAAQKNISAELEEQNRKLEEQKQQQGAVTTEVENTTGAVQDTNAAHKTAVTHTNTLKDAVSSVTTETNILKDAWIALAGTLLSVVTDAQAAETAVAKVTDAAQGSNDKKPSGILSIFSDIKQGAKSTYASVVAETSSFFETIANIKINTSQLERNFFGFFTDAASTLRGFTSDVNTVDIATPFDHGVAALIRSVDRLSSAINSFVTDSRTTLDQWIVGINESINNLNISDTFQREVDSTTQSFNQLKTNFNTSVFGNFVNDTVSTFSTFASLVNTEIERIDLSFAVGREMDQAVTAIEQGSNDIITALSSSSFYVDWLKPFAENTQTTLSTLNSLATSEVNNFVKNFDLSQTSEMRGFANFIDSIKQKAGELVNAFGNTTEAKTFFELFNTVLSRGSSALATIGAAGKQQGKELDIAFRQALFAYSLWKNKVEEPVKIDNRAFEVFKNAEQHVDDALGAAVDFLQFLPQLQSKSEQITIFSTLPAKVNGTLETVKTLFKDTLTFIKAKIEGINLNLNVKIKKDQATNEAVNVSKELDKKIQSQLTPYDIVLKIADNAEQNIQDVLSNGLTLLDEYTKPRMVDIRYMYQDADRIDELTKKIKELRSQQPQGIFKTPLVDSAELQRLQQLLLKEYAKPILLDTTQAKKQNTDLKNEIAKPVVANVTLKQAESELSTLLARRKELEINPRVNAEELADLNAQIKALENKVITLKLKTPQTSSYAPLGPESIIQSGKISTALQTSLNEVKQFQKGVNNVWTNTEARQGVKMNLDTVQLEHQLRDAEGKVKIWHEQVQRLTATGLDIGGKQLEFPIPNFQVQASTWEQLVSEGNRYMNLKAKVDVDPSFANKVQDVKPVIKPEVDAVDVNAELNKIELKERTVQIGVAPLTDAELKKELAGMEEFNYYKLHPEIDLETAKNDVIAQYEQTVQELGKGNPIEVTLEANKFVGAIQEELAALQNSGATNITVTLDETTNKLIIHADIDQANSKARELADQIAAMNPVMTVDIKYNDPGSGSLQRNQGGLIGRNQGGLIGSIQRFADGGFAKFKELAAPFVPGSGNTDTVPAMLTPGEFVIKKDRVKELGVDFLNSLNNGLIQFKSMGGMIYNSPVNTLNKMSKYIQPNYQIPQPAQLASGPSIDINLTIKDKKFNIKTPRDQVDDLVSAFKHLNRTL